MFKATTQTTDEIRERRKPSYWYKAVVEEFERAIKEVNINLYKVFTSIFHSLKESYILDSGSSIYIMKNKQRLLKYKTVSLRNKLKCGRSYMVIQGYKDLDIQLTN